MSLKVTVSFNVSWLVKYPWVRYTALRYVVGQILEGMLPPNSSYIIEAFLIVKSLLN